MTFDELKDKALSLPYAPGVYIMRDKTDKVIYVGKAKKLKNRVSQYFQDTAAHTPKTKMMVSKIHHFDVIGGAGAGMLPHQALYAKIQHSSEG